ncbi:MAG TPA: ribonuclease E/G [Alphaproteobacteria bacterium]|jgi:ribonuclease G
MTIEILLARSGRDSHGAVLTDGVLTDYRVERGAAPSRVGGIYRARVKKIMPGLAGAVVEFPGGEAWLDLERARREKPREGDVMTVQIVQDGQVGKLPRAAADPLVAGRFLALQPKAAKPALSHRIADNDARARLGALLAKLGDGGHFLALHGAPAASDAMLEAEAGRLRAVWRGAAPALAANAPAEAVAPPDPLLDLLRLFVGADTARIAVDSEALAETVRGWLALHAPEWPGKVEREPVGRTTLEGEAVRAELAAALEREVPLRGGGVLVIETAAGTTVIDVDTDRAAAASAKATFASVNREAAREIARQIRLRNLGGRIVVDFAGLGEARALPAALAILRGAVAHDPMAVRIAPPSEFGLVELLRRRERRTLAEMLVKA